VARGTPAAGRPARRKGRAPYRWIIFGPAPVAGPLAWAGLGEPFRGAGLLALLALGVLAVPAAMLALVTAPGTLAHAVVPRDWRRRWRHHKKHPGPPPALLQRVVRAADRNRCAACGITAAEVRRRAQARQLAAGSMTLTRSSLQFDHFFPWSLGGLMSFWNLFLLCPDCNLAKSSYWEFPDGHYTDGYGTVSGRLAAAILNRERRARWSLARCWRAAWAL
jgi:5-methylcytosine-specific restriction endonuclease McrA